MVDARLVDAADAHLDCERHLIACVFGVFVGERGEPLLGAWRRARLGWASLAHVALPHPSPVLADIFVSLALRRAAFRNADVHACAVRNVHTCARVINRLRHHTQHARDTKRHSQAGACITAHPSLPLHWCNHTNTSAGKSSAANGGSWGRGRGSSAPRSKVRVCALADSSDTSGSMVGGGGGRA